MSATSSVLGAIWFWIKGHWKSILLGVSTLGIGLLVGRALKKPSEVVAPELEGAEKERQEAQAEEDDAIAEAARKRAEQLARLEEEHKDNLKDLTADQAARVEELKDDPEALNAFLLQVGKSMRDE